MKGIKWYLSEEEEEEKKPRTWLRMIQKFLRKRQRKQFSIGKQITKCEKINICKDISFLVSKEKSKEKTFSHKYKKL